MCMVSHETENFSIVRFQSNHRRLDVVSKDGSEKYTFYIYDGRVTHFSRPIKVLVPKVLVPYEVAQIVRGLGYTFARAIEIEEPI